MNLFWMCGSSFAVHGAHPVRDSDGSDSIHPLCKHDAMFTSQYCSGFCLPSQTLSYVTVPTWSLSGTQMGNFHIYLKIHMESHRVTHFLPHSVFTSVWHHFNDPEHVPCLDYPHLVFRSLASHETDCSSSTARFDLSCYSRISQFLLSTSNLVRFSGSAVSTYMFVYVFVFVACFVVLFVSLHHLSLPPSCFPSLVLSKLLSTDPFFAPFHSRSGHVWSYARTSYKGGPIPTLWSIFFMLFCDSTCR
jgi:hypothetical protein